MRAHLLLTPDDRRLVVVDPDGQLWVVDARSGERVHGPVRMGGEPVAALLEPGGSVVVVVTGRGVASRFDLAALKTIDAPYRLEETATAAAASDKLLVLGGSRGSLFGYPWETTTPSMRVRLDGQVTALSMAPDGTWFAAAGTDGTVALWTIDGQPFGRRPIKLDSAATSVAVAPDSRRLATGSAGGLVRLWQPDGQPVSGPIELAGAVVALAWQPQGNQLAAASAKGEARLIDAIRGRPAGDPLSHDGAVTALAFDGQGRRLATGGEDGLVQLWDANSGRRTTDPLRHDGKVQALAFLPDEKQVATLASDALMRRFAVESGQPSRAPLELRGDAPPPARPTVAPAPGTFTRVGTDAIVTVGGVVGVFTPIGGEAQGPVGADERANLTAIIDRLKKELAAAQSANRQLQADLQTLRERPTTASDFASGVQQSLDELAQRMTTMRNPVSNFAVREFKLDASVFVQVTPTGAIEYRFVQPGDEAPPAAVSKLSMSVVPLPKDNLAGVWTPNLFQPEIPVAALPGITAPQARQLEGQGAFSIGEFLQTATRLRAQAVLEALLEVDRTRLALWAQQAALMTLRGVDGRMAQFLIELGVGSFEALAAVAPQALALRIAQALAANPVTGVAPITVALAALWIRAARQYLGLPAIEEPDTPPPPAVPPSPPPPR
jgi:WD40 repeat protein